MLGRPLDPSSTVVVAATVRAKSTGIREELSKVCMRAMRRADINMPMRARAGGQPKSVVSVASLAFLAIVFGRARKVHK